MKNLDLATIRSFHTVVKLGSVSRASEELFLTQSAISQHIKRLETLINLKLFEREGRSIILTKQGDEFFEETKSLLVTNDFLLDKYCCSNLVKIVSIGLSEHLSQQYLPSLLRSCSELPQVQLDVKIGLNGPLYADMESGELDIVVLINEKDSLVQKPVLAIPQKLCWVAAKGKQYEDGQVVPVVLYSGPCLFRTMLISTLNAHKQKWRTVYSASSITDLTAAIRASLGFSALLESEIDEEMSIIDCDILPSLPDVDAVVYVNKRERKEINLIIDILNDLLIPSPPLNISTT